MVRGDINPNCFDGWNRRDGVFSREGSLKWRWEQQTQSMAGILSDSQQASTWMRLCRVVETQSARNGPQNGDCSEPASPFVECLVAVEPPAKSLTFGGCGEHLYFQKSYSLRIQPEWKSHLFSKEGAKVHQSNQPRMVIERKTAGS